MHYGENIVHIIRRSRKEKLEYLKKGLRLILYTVLVSITVPNTTVVTKTLAPIILKGIAYMHRVIILIIVTLSYGE